MQVPIFKKGMLLMTIALGCLSVNAQKIDPEVKAESEPLRQLGNNEIRLNVAYSIAGFPEVNYERFLEDNMGLGIAAAISLEKAEDMANRWNIMPYYRLYFGNKKASGFFIEGNMTVWGQRQIGEYYTWDTLTYNITSYDKSFVNFGMGAALGVKLLARNGFIGEVYAGGGRLFGNREAAISKDYSISATAGYFRLGICIGKRF
jgi:hypothetical protein